MNLYKIVDDKSEVTDVIAKTFISAQGLWEKHYKDSTMRSIELAQEDILVQGVK